MLVVAICEPVKRTQRDISEENDFLWCLKVNNSKQEDPLLSSLSTVPPFSEVDDLQDSREDLGRPEEGVGGVGAEEGGRKDGQREEEEG